MLQLHLSDQQFYSLLRCDLYQRVDGKLPRLISVKCVNASHVCHHLEGLALALSTCIHAKALRNMPLRYYNAIGHHRHSVACLSDAMCRWWSWFTYFQVMAWHLFGIKPLPETTMDLRSNRNETQLCVDKMLRTRTEGGVHWHTGELIIFIEMYYERKVNIVDV